jgi:hypothetical protein
VGFVYFVQKWFRYFLKEHIERSRYSIESKAKGDGAGWGMMQLDYRPYPEEVDLSNERLMPCADGQLQDPDGQSWAADMGMMNKSFDVNGMDMAWVHNTTDPLFRKLTTNERYILYATFKQEMPITDIARALKISARECHEQLEQILIYLRDRAKSFTHGT